jgi:formylglycine-generating enzyme required for sulfatase activity
MLLLPGSASHSVAFAISARPVSQAQFRTFCQRTSRPYPRQPWSDDDDPVVNVTWDEAREYLAWLSATTGKRYRLATESEWLYFTSQGKIETRWRNGNVREWMQDTVDDRNTNNAEFSAVLDSDTTEPADPNDHEFQRVVRGVSYADPTAELLTARRVRNASTRDALTGFRALREVP